MVVAPQAPVVLVGRVAAVVGATVVTGVAAGVGAGVDAGVVEVGVEEVQVP